MFLRYDHVMRCPLIGTIVLPLALWNAQSACRQAKANVQDAARTSSKCTTPEGIAGGDALAAPEYHKAPAPHPLTAFGNVATSAFPLSNAQLSLTPSITSIFHPTPASHPPAIYMSYESYITIRNQPSQRPTLHRPQNGSRQTQIFPQRPAPRPDRPNHRAPRRRSRSLPTARRILHGRIPPQRRHRIPPGPNPGRHRLAPEPRLRARKQSLNPRHGP